MSGRISQWRERLGISQTDLARMVGVHQAELSHLERAQRIAPKVRAALMVLEERRQARRRYEERAAEVEAAWQEAGGCRAAEIAKRAMLDVAWKLLDIGKAELADELLDALSTADAQRLLDEYFADEMSDEPPAGGEA